MGEDSYEFPYSLAQHTCWYLDGMAPCCATDNIAVRFLLTGPLDIPLLDETLLTICLHHEVLRTRFVEKDEQPKQVVEPHPKGIKVESPKRHNSQKKTGVRKCPYAQYQ